MKFENILNPFAENIESIILSEKETAYIAMLVSGSGRYKASEFADMKDADIDDLYQKFGLTDKRFDRDSQLSTIASLNRMITEDILKDVYEKYNVLE